MDKKASPLNPPVKELLENLNFYILINNKALPYEFFKRLLSILALESPHQQDLGVCLFLSLRHDKKYIAESY